MKVEVLMMPETKIGETFQSWQFYIERFTFTYMLDWNCHRGGILVYSREDISSKLIEMNISVESIFIELNLRKKEWLVNWSYNAKNSNICDHLWSLGKSLHTLLTNYDKVILMEDFNAEEANIHINNFCNLYKLKTWSKFQHVWKKQITQDYLFHVQKFSPQFPKLMWTWTFIKSQLLSLNRTWKRNNLKSYLIGTLGTVVLKHNFCEIFQLCIYLVIPRPYTCM